MFRCAAATCSQHAVKRVSLEQIAKLQILPEHVETLVAAEPLELGRMFATVHASGERAALEAVSAEIPPLESRLHGARFDDRGDGPGRDRLTADPGQGRGLLPGRAYTGLADGALPASTRPGLFRQPDAAEHRAGLDSASLQPGCQRTHRAQLSVAIGQGDDHRVRLRTFWSGAG